MSERAQLLLSDRILGSTFAPMGGVWNYSIGLGAQFTQSMSYAVTLTGSPLQFWDPLHRPNHFAAFVASEGAQDETDNQDAFA
ncbi:PROCT-domain-containing protein [Atractiella rhizophila]|nr:PROCT-domain-containing protein [Atractiella rhizophila]